jgi:hypothetical protein
MTVTSLDCFLTGRRLCHHSKIRLQTQDSNDSLAHEAVIVDRHDTDG